MDYTAITKMKAYKGPLWHGVELSRMFSVKDEGLLCFILKYRVPGEKFIRMELAKRGHDKDCKWFDLEKAKILLNLNK